MSNKATVKVQLPGTATTEVTLQGNVNTVGDALLAAAKALGVNLVPEQVAAIQNGRQVTTDAPVEDGDMLAAAGNVANG